MLLLPLAQPLHGLLPLVGDDTSRLGGLISLLAAGGAIVAMATRAPGEARLESRTPGAEPERLWMIGPFIGALGFVAGDSLDRLGLPGGDALIGVGFLVAVGSVIFASRLPVVARSTRRLLVAPFVLLSASFFQALAADVVEGLGGTGGPLAGLFSLDQLPLLMAALGVLLACAGIFYLMLIFVPRELADPGGTPLAWSLRFALFAFSLVVAVVLGSTFPLLTL